MARARQATNAQKARWTGGGPPRKPPKDFKGTSRVRSQALITHTNTTRRLKGTSMIPHSKNVRAGVKVSGALAVASGVGYAGYKIHQRRAINKNPTTTPKIGAQQPQKFGARVGSKR